MMRFIIISGLSGSGKSIALRALEDMGYYCIDNLPAALLPQFATQLQHAEHGYENVAVSIDSRNRSFLQTISENLDAIESLGIEYNVIFLKADENILIKRFSETRRKHPLTDTDKPLIESIRMEDELLSPLSSRANKLINTSNTTPQELRSLIRDFIGAVSTYNLSILFESFGYKHGIPQDADFVFDVRCLPNPYWDAELRPFNGTDQAVVNFLRGKPDVRKMIDQIFDFVNGWLPNFEADHRSYITVAIGCTGGQHRSVYIANELAGRFSNQHLNIQIRHRELS
jgi:UPF0042 nucleotide-binding protein